MDDIQGIVGDIVAGCASQGLVVSETLAAFVARTVVHENAQSFRLDKHMNEDDVDDLIRMSVDRLLENDSPSLETIKMQVAFDTSYVEQDDALEKQRLEKEHALSELTKKIVEMKPRSHSDFESLTALYRQIFMFLMRFSDVVEENREVEREVAAALESVFPRIGLKSFVALGAEDKRTQLHELANIVQGIRLFNKEIGKGGAALDDTVNLVQVAVNDLALSLQNDVHEVSSACQMYTDVLVYVYHFRPEGVSEPTVRRWQQELTNRRQLLSYIQSLQEDVMMSAQKVDSARDTFRSEMQDLKSLVGLRTSVPKEQVYPKFDALAVMWRHLAQEHRLVRARLATYGVLNAFGNSFQATVLPNSSILQTARKVGMPSVEAEAAAAAAASEAVQENNLLGAGQGTGTDEAGEGSLTAGAGGGDGGDADAAEGRGDAGSGAGGSGGDGERAVRLSIESTPEFMQLPLEYQGYCPWTLVTRGGLLLPGNPALGVVRYKNTFNVFVHEVALVAFMQAPQRYARGVLLAAMKAPELIHLLRLQEHFPLASLSRLLRGGSDPALEGQHPLLAPTPAAKVDASTSTPVHFIEKRLDPNYDWNEWSLRRKALQLANLRKAKTTSVQTTSSHFRREADTQVYLPRHNTSQTATDRGTNPARMVTYLAGLRGDLAEQKRPEGPSRYVGGRKKTDWSNEGKLEQEDEEQIAESKTAEGEKDAYQEKKGDRRSRVVNLTFEI